MKRIGILGLAGLVGCSFIDDFDRFRAVDAGGSTLEEGGTSEDTDDATAQDAGRSPGARLDGGDDTPDGDPSGGDDAPDARPPGTSRQDAGAPDSSRDGATPFCGDGLTDEALGEECDDGNMKTGDGCEPFTCHETPACGGSSCNDNDVCTRDRCEGDRCAATAIDVDRDGYSPGTCAIGSALRGGDCDDTEPSISPGAPEACNGLDDNCNGRIDEGFPLTLCYPDRDGDGYPDLKGTPVRTCMPCAAGTVAVAEPVDQALGDCLDEGDEADLVHPGQTQFYERGYRLPSASGGTRSFDYDCNEVDEPQYGELTQSCGGLLGLLCDGSTNGFSPLPQCGETGTYVICAMNGLSCGISESRKQLCR